MWLLLVAAGTGYLARCWQKARKFKSGSRVLKANAAIHVSQRSPSCTPKRGRPTTSSRRGLRKRSQSAKGLNRKLLPGRRDGRLAKTHTRDWDENLGSSEKFFEGLLLGEDFSGQCASALKDQDTPGQVQALFEASCLHGNNYTEPYQSQSTMCVQDHLRESSLCMEKPLLFGTDDDTKESIERDHSFFCTSVLPNNKPVFGNLHGFPATTLDSVKNQLEMVDSSSKGCVDCSKPRENGESNSQLMHAVPCLQVPRIKTRRGIERQNLPFKFKESTEQAFGFVAKVARDLGQRTCSTLASRFSNGMGRNPFLNPGLLQNTRGVSACKRLSFERPRNDIPLEEKREKHGLGPCVLDSRLLKALLDPEFLDQCHRCNHLTISISNHDLENAMARSSNFAGFSMSMADGRPTQNPDGNSKTSISKPSKGQASEFTNSTNQSVKLTSEPSCERRNCLLSSNEGSLLAVGVAMGMLFVANYHNCQLKDLHKLLKETNSMIQELKKQVDSRLELDPLTLPEVEKYNEKVPSNLTMADGTRPWKAHLRADTNSCKSTPERSSLELFSADNNHVGNIFSENHVHGLDDLEAELEAELQLMELNVCNTDLDEYECNQTQSNKTCWQPERDDNVYVDTDIRDSMPVQAADQLYESDFIVSPVELERRLWQVLEQRQEERICELENDLHITHEKVTAKELEIQWWKDRVWWLMETSLGGKQGNTQSLFIE